MNTPFLCCMLRLPSGANALHETLVEIAVCNMPEAEMSTNLLKLLAIRGEDETGAWENCSLLLRCCFRFCRM